MAHANGSDLSGYYQRVEKMGLLHTRDIARRWSKAVLWTLGLNLDRKTKKKLADALPEELSDDLTRAFWLLHFRNTELSRHDFLKAIAKRSGASDAAFARYPTAAVFHEVKAMVGADVSRDVAETLSPEVRELWEKA